ncbi:MAG: TonB family protein [Arcticibacterium sp.]|jgi:TonB family protein
MNWINYLLQVNLYLILTFGFYWLLLRKETFYHANRFYLLATSLISFAIPFWQSGIIQSWTVTEQISSAVAVIPLQEFTISNLSDTPTWDWNLLLASIYFFGFGFGLLRFSIGLFKLQQLFNLHNLEGQAFSVFGKIFIDKNLDDYQTIKNHEEVHSKEFHSLDVFWFELIGVICWFNPIVHFMQKEIKLVHEYVADEKAALFLGSKKSYALVLVGSHFKANGNVLVNNFYNKSILKTRIVMLSRQKSKKTAIVKYGLIAPLFLGMFVFTAACTESSLNSTSIEELAPQGLLKEESINSGNIIGEIEGDVLTNVEIAPQFPNGGVKKMYEFINKNIKYPKAAQSANISGRVFVKFVVDKEGKVRDPSILKGIGFGADKETIRVVKRECKLNSV